MTWYSNKYSILPNISVYSTYASLRCAVLHKNAVILGAHNFVIAASLSGRRQLFSVPSYRTDINYVFFVNIASLLPFIILRVLLILVCFDFKSSVSCFLVYIFHNFYCVCWRLSIDVTRSI